MNQNVLTNALQSMDLRNLDSHESDANVDEADDDDGGGGDGGALNNWYLSGLQTVKLRSPSECENLSEMESDFDDVLRYESEDGVKPFSETDDDEEINAKDHREDFGRGNSYNKYVQHEDSSGEEEEDEEESENERTVIEANNEVVVRDLFLLNIFKLFLDISVKILKTPIT